jgi:Regulator of ribonuclease activity B
LGIAPRTSKLRGQVGTWFIHLKAEPAVADAEIDGAYLLRLNPIDGETPSELSTGDPEDDHLLRQIAARVPLDQPRGWKHYLYVPDEPSAQMVAGILLRIAHEGVGFEVEIYAPDKEGEAYCVTAEREGTVLTAELVRQSRELFEMITSHVTGAEYDGWEVAIDTDDYFEAST